MENKEIRDLITEYLEENEQGMRELMTWFLNQVMDYEAEQQSGAGRYVRGKGRRAHRNGHSAQGMDCSNCPSHSCVSFHSEQRSSKHIPGWRMH